MPEQPGEEHRAGAIGIVERLPVVPDPQRDQPQQAAVVVDRNQQARSPERQTARTANSARGSPPTSQWLPSTIAG